MLAFFWTSLALGGKVKLDGFAGERATRRHSRASAEQAQTQDQCQGQFWFAQRRGLERSFPQRGYLTGDGPGGQRLAGGDVPGGSRSWPK
jgi:hypothetical protein